MVDSLFDRRAFKTSSPYVSMLQSTLRIALASSAIGIPAAQIVAQSPQLNSVTAETQAPIPSAGHDYLRLLNETVNYSNGSVSFKFSFPTIPGRAGLQLSPSWSYNSGSVSPLDAESGIIPVFDSQLSHNWPQVDGWNLMGGVPMGTSQMWSVAAHENDNQTAIPCSFEDGFTFTGMDGVQHSLLIGAITSVNEQGLYYTCQGANTAIPPNGDGQVVGTIAENATALLSPTTGATTAPFVVTDKNGTIYLFPGGFNGSFPGSYIPPSLIEDRNGNQIGFGTGANWNSANSPFTIDGLEYTPTWGTTPVAYPISSQLAAQTNVGCFAVPPQVGPTYNNGTYVSGPGERVALNSLQLSNETGFTYEYLFQYDTTYGLIKQITYPDGGWVQYSWGLESNSNGSPIYNEIASIGGEVQQGTLSYNTEDLNWDPISNFDEGTVTTSSESYTYNAVPTGCNWAYQAPVLLSRTVSFDGVNVAQTQTFSYNTNWQFPSNPASGGWISKTTTVFTTDKLVSPSRTSAVVYSYSPYYLPKGPFSGATIANAIPLENTTQYYDWAPTASGGSQGLGPLLKTVTRQWKDQFNLLSQSTTDVPAGVTSKTTYSYISGICNNPSATDIFLQDSVSSLVYLQEQDDYDFGTPTPTRKTIYNYTCPPGGTVAAALAAFLTAWGGGSINWTNYFTSLSLPAELQSVTIEDGNNNVLAATQYQYDTQPAPLPSVSAISHDSSYGQSMTTRGNLNSVTHCNPLPANPTASCSGPTTKYTYDITGQPATMVDPCGNTACSDIQASSHTTIFSFTDNPTNGNGSAGNTNAYLTSITYPGVSNPVTFQYNYLTYPIGSLSQSTDENLATTKYYYGQSEPECSSQDQLFRLTEVHYPDGGDTQNCYNDQGHSATTNVLLSGGAWKTTTETFDGMGHATTSQLTSDPDIPGGADTTFTSYDGEGHAYWVTNPFRSPLTTTTAPRTYHLYDSLGRPIETIDQDTTSVQQICYDGVASLPAVIGVCNGLLLGTNRFQTGSVAGTWVDQMDENGNDWQRASDAFGRLSRVMEPGSSPTPPSMETDYAYDPIGNLLSVSQYGGPRTQSAARSRSFSYDGLSRLINAYNPETGTIVYSYDADGNVQSKTDARGVVTTYQYNGVNKLLSKTYTNDPTGTPTSCYQYGNNTTGIVNRLTDAWTQTSSTCSLTGSLITHRHISVGGYDLMGRILNESQYTPAILASGQTYAPAYTYDPAGNLLTWMDGITPSPTQSGSKLTFTNTIGGAGRIISTTSNWSDATHPGTLFSVGTAQSTTCTSPPFTSGQYTAFGGLSNAQYGADLVLNRAYDSRMRIGCELDQQTSAPSTPATATVTITGSEQTK